MNYSPARVLYGVLTEGSGSLLTVPTDSEDWPLYVGSMPETPHDCAAIFDTAGIVDAREFDGTIAQRFGFTIQFRAETYNDGWVKALAVGDYLATVHNADVTVVVTDFEVESVTQEGTVLAIGVEPGTTRRSMFTYNGLVRLKEV